MNAPINKLNNLPKPHQQLLEAERLMATYWNQSQRFVEVLKSLGFEQAQLLTQAASPVSETAGLTEYQAQTLIFNTRLRFYPAVIVMCRTTDDVAVAYQQAIKLNLPIRVRSGGHDHEGECTGTDVILLDLSGLKEFSVEKVQDEYVATVGSGYRFFQLVPKLADTEGGIRPALTIPHGTCATVGLAGYIQGGGWGPWTRTRGMCCESLVGATVVLGNGEVIDVSEDNNRPLLWALRGGGALSYGIVTRFRVKAFEIPDEIHRFEIHWNTDDSQALPTWDILSDWEGAINDTSTADLVGTNLKINAISTSAAPKDLTKLAHPCTMYGYWNGNWDDLKIFVSQYFPGSKVVWTGTDNNENYDESLMGNWSRNSLYELSAKHNLLDPNGVPFTPDFDEPAPHKITSKVVTREGLKKCGKEQLLCSLTSDLISSDNARLGLYSYVTLGAIVGSFYENTTQEEAHERVAFPYSTAQYTIQYQTWWNEKICQKEKGQDNFVFNYINRAMDWIDVCRDTEIEGTKGSFISFKDSSIPTEHYFPGSYEELIEVKREFSHDCNNHLRTRKTIV